LDFEDDVDFDFDDPVPAAVEGVVVAVVGAAAAAAPPVEPWMTILDGPAARWLPTLSRPMRTPTPIASRSTPTPRIRLALDDIQPQRVGRCPAAMAGAPAAVVGIV
jgi:hypothetical protein